MFVACLWFAYFAQWGSLLSIVIPAQVADIVGAQQKYFFNGLVIGVGALLALIVAPVAGALSDRTAGRRGRRRPYLIAGVVANCICLALLAPFGHGSNIWWFLIAYLGVQLSSNFWGGPYAGLIPDVVPREQRGVASGWLMTMTVSGTIVGVLAAGVLIRNATYLWYYAFVIGALAVALCLTLVRVREPPAALTSDAFDLGKFARSFYIKPREQPNFYWVLVTRAFVAMGTYSLYNFLEYFIADILRVSHPAQAASRLFGAAAAIALPFCLVAGRFADRYGRIPLVRSSGGIMAAAAIAGIFITLHPSWPLSIAIAIAYGIGNCAYQAVDWALALDVLPAGAAWGKDMGIWHVAIVLPQSIAPLITGLILDRLKLISLAVGYTSAFAIAAFWFTIGVYFVNRIRGVR